jgi:hypothetical protein
MALNSTIARYTMTHPHFHAVSSAEKYGGIPENYIEIHNWFDDSKEYFCDARHRALKHHSQGIFECEKVFGLTIINSDQKTVPVRYIGEQHVREDCGGFIPSISDWLKNMRMQSWMNRGYKE